MDSKVPPLQSLFGTYPETMEERFGYWTELWDVLDWLECVLRPGMGLEIYGEPAHSKLKNWSG